MSNTYTNIIQQNLTNLAVGKLDLLFVVLILVLVRDHLLNAFVFYLVVVHQKVLYLDLQVPSLMLPRLRLFLNQLLHLPCLFSAHFLLGFKFFLFCQQVALG